MKITLKILFFSLFCAAMSSCITGNHVERLITDLKDEDPQIREESAQALGKVHSTQSAKALLDALNDKDSAVRWNAAMSLGWIKDPCAIDSLIIALNDDYPCVRKYAVWSLGRIDGPQVVEPLMNALNDKDSDVRWNSIRALEKINDPRVTKPFITSLSDDNLAITIVAAKFLKENKNLILQEIKEHQVTEYLVANLTSEYDHVRRAAAEILAETKDPGAIEPLILTLKDDDAGVRYYAAMALGEIDDPRVIDPLGKVLRHKDVAAVAGAYKFFIRRGESGTEATLISGLNRYGNPQTAHAFMASGNAQLREAAEKWLRINLITSASPSGANEEPHWGEDKKNP